MNVWADRSGHCMEKSFWMGFDCHVLELSQFNRSNWQQKQLQQVIKSLIWIIPWLNIGSDLAPGTIERRGQGYGWTGIWYLGEGFQFSRVLRRQIDLMLVFVCVHTCCLDGIWGTNKQQAEALESIYLNIECFQTKRLSTQQFGNALIR